LQSVRESITTVAPEQEEGAEEQAMPELSQERKEAVVDKLVKTSVELNGGLEAAERGECGARKPDAETTPDVLW
jgi:hypothetical protein